MKWEYMTISLGPTGSLFSRNFDYGILNEKLNSLGAEGWELVSTFDTNIHEGRSDQIIAILKRPIG